MICWISNGYNKSKHNRAMKKRIALDGLHYVSAACIGGVTNRLGD